MLALGKPEALLVFDLIVLAGYAGLVFWVSQYGLVAVCVAVALFQLGVLTAQYSILERRYLGVPLRTTWAAIVPATVAAGSAVLVALPVERSLRGDAPALVVAGVAAIVLTAGYAGVLRVAFRPLWDETMDVVLAVARPHARDTRLPRPRRTRRLHRRRAV